MNGLITSLSIIIGVIILLWILTKLGDVRSKHDNYAEHVNKKFKNLELGIVDIKLYIFFIAIFVLMITEVMNISKFTSDYLKIQLPDLILLTFGILSIVSAIFGSTKAKELAKDGEFSWSDISQVLIYFFFAILADIIFVGYGYIVHVVHYDIKIEQLHNDFKAAQNPVFGYTKQELYTKLRSIQSEISALTVEKWSGRYRILLLIVQVIASLILNIMVTFAYGINKAKEIKDKIEEDDDKKDKDKDRDEKDKDKETVGGGPIKGLSANPFRRT